MPIVKPEFAGRRGQNPQVVRLNTFEQEIDHIANWLSERRAEKVPLRDMAVLYRDKWQAEKIEKGLKARGLPVEWVTRDSKSKRFDPGADNIKLITMYSSKGLEFHSVAIPDLGNIPHRDEDVAHAARLLYVAMTRATENLLTTFHTEGAFTAKLQNILSDRD